MSVSLPKGTKFYVKINSEWTHLIVINDEDRCAGCFFDDVTNGGTSFPDEDKLYACNSIACKDTLRHDKTNVKVVKEEE